MKPEAVKSSYARWAPVYDQTFGVLTNHGRRRTVGYINDRGGSVLEVGVGTGLSLPLYRPHLDVTGIDYSEEMLEKAKARRDELGLENVALRQMDARRLDFPDDSFDTVTAMHVLSVVPEPEKVMSEIARVVKPGGKVVITNHFKHDTGLLAFLSRISRKLDHVLGWHSDFEIGRVLQEEMLAVEDQSKFPPFGMMTFLVMAKPRVA